MCIKITKNIEIVQYFIRFHFIWLVIKSYKPFKTYHRSLIFFIQAILKRFKAVFPTKELDRDFTTISRTPKIMCAKFRNRGHKRTHSKTKMYNTNEKFRFAHPHLIILQETDKR